MPNSLCLRLDFDVKYAGCQSFCPAWEVLAAAPEMAAFAALITISVMCGMGWGRIGWGSARCTSSFDGNLKHNQARDRA